MQRIAGLEPQRVPGAEPARDDPAPHHAVPQLAHHLGRAEELAAALARVARPAQEHRDPEHLFLAERERGHLDPEQLERPRPLHGEHRPASRDIPGLVQPPRVDLDVGRVDDEEVAVVAAVRDQVVDHPAGVVRQQRVLGLTRRDPVEVVRQEALEVVVGAFSRDLELAHVRDVEDPGMPPHREVLLDDRRVLHGHLPARERDETGPERLRGDRTAACAGASAPGVDPNAARIRQVART